MKKQYLSIIVFAVISLVTFYACSDKADKITDPVNSQSLEKKQAGNVNVTVFASGLNAPRGLKFGPDGNLYVSEAGLGGSISTDGQCDQVIPPVGPYLGGYTARILKINSAGTVTTVSDNLPSAQDAMGDKIGVSDVAFLNNQLYALLGGGGCSHGHSDVPASIIKVNSNGTWSVVADLSIWQRDHHVAVPEEDDFEPDGSWYSMVNVHNDLYALEANHGELVKVSASGDVSRVIDFSAHYGHIVPTTITYRGNFFVGNLDQFPSVGGTSKIYKVTPSGVPQVWAEGFTQVLGVVFDKNSNMYVLEASSVPGYPTPNTGKIIKVLPSGEQQVLVDGLFFPTSMTIGPDGAFYVSNKGFGPPVPGFGEILKITVN